jgi:hypothetical protein
VRTFFREPLLSKPFCADAAYLVLKWLKVVFVTESGVAGLLLCHAEHQLKEGFCAAGQEPRRALNAPRQLILF